MPPSTDCWVSRRISSSHTAGVLLRGRIEWSRTAAGRTIVNEWSAHPTKFFAAAAAAPCMPLLCHTVTEHGWVIVKYSAPSRAGEEEGGDDHGADGDGEVEEVAEEGGVSRSGKYSCWKDEGKKQQQPDGPTVDVNR